MATTKFRIAVLCSGTGSNLQALIDAQACAALGSGEIALVASERATAYALQRALAHNIAAAYVPLVRTAPGTDKDIQRSAWERRLADIVAAFVPDLVVLAGFMRLLSANFLERFPDRVINQHPALLPANGGDEVVTTSGVVIPALRGAHVVAEAIARGLPITGCSIHRVTPRLDDGPLLASTEVVVLPGDSVATLHERIKQEERRLIVEVVAALACARQSEQ